MSLPSPRTTSPDSDTTRPVATTPAPRAGRQQRRQRGRRRDHAAPPPTPTPRVALADDPVVLAIGQLVAASEQRTQGAIADLRNELHDAVQALMPADRVMDRWAHDEEVTRTQDARIAAMEAFSAGVDRKIALMPTREEVARLIREELERSQHDRPTQSTVERLIDQRVDRYAQDHDVARMPAVKLAIEHEFNVRAAANRGGLRDVREWLTLIIALLAILSAAKVINLEGLFHP